MSKRREIGGPAHGDKEQPGKTGARKKDGNTNRAVNRPAAKHGVTRHGSRPLSAPADAPVGDGVL